MRLRRRGDQSHRNNVPSELAGTMDSALLTRNQRTAQFFLFFFFFFLARSRWTTDGRCGCCTTAATTASTPGCFVTLIIPHPIQRRISVLFFCKTTKYVTSWSSTLFFGAEGGGNGLGFWTGRGANGGGRGFLYSHATFEKLLFHRRFRCSENLFTSVNETCNKSS